MAIGVFLRSAIKSTGMLAKFGAKYQARSAVHHISKFKEDWNKLIKSVDQYEITKVIDLLNSEIEEIKKGGETSFELFLTAKKLEIQLISLFQKGQKEFSKLKNQDSHLQNLIVQIEERKKTLLKIVDEEIRKQYKKLLQLEDAASQDNAQNLMSTFQKLMKKKEATYYDMYKISSDIKGEVNAKYHAESSLNEIKKLIKKLETITDQKSRRTIVKDLTTETKNFFNHIEFGFRQEHDLVMREIYLLFLILNNIDSLFNLEQRITKERVIPELIGKEIDQHLDEAKALIQKLAHAEEQGELKSEHELQKTG